ncbi:MAG: agmatinase [Candidatus Aenigmarchaeota archaeon]|nr:agmatinase [Candidatus Aenigmarchaeota archaeon]
MQEHITNRFPSNVERFEDAEVVVFGVPFDSTVDFLVGTRFGPKIIREAACFIEPFDVQLEKNLLDEVKIFDAGDIEPVRGSSEDTIKRVEQQFKQIIDAKKFPLMLGGEHSTSLGAVKVLPKNTKIVCFDAHYDLKERWEGSEYTHNTWLRRAAELIGEKNICLIGVRTGDEFEHEFGKNLLVNPTIEELTEFVKGSSIYLTIDMDVFDPAYAPGVGTPEPFGMMPEFVLSLIELIAKAGKVLGMDVVETRPLEDRKTEILAARLIFKVLMYRKLTIKK